MGSSESQYACDNIANLLHLQSDFPRQLHLPVDASLACSSESCTSRDTDGGEVCLSSRNHDFQHLRYSFSSGAITFSELRGEVPTLAGDERLLYT